MAEASRRVGQIAGLVLALAFVLTASYIPHLDAASADTDEAPGGAWGQMVATYADLAAGEHEGYPYPIHVDEHIHWVYASAIQRFASLDHPEIYTGQAQDSEGVSLRGGVHERGFHLALGQFQDMTGISWWSVFQYGPMLWAGLIAVLVWAALDPWPGAPVAAGLTGLMPTTVRFLGPGFLVPITFGLAWVGVLLVLLPRLGRSFRGPALALLTVFWAFFIHVIAGFVALALLLAAIPFVAGQPEEEGMRARLAGIGLVAALPMIWLYEAFWEEIRAEAEAFTDLPLDVTVFDQIGVAFLAAWVLGLGLIGYRRPRRRETQFGACALLSLVVLATILSNFHLGPRLALYDRFHQPFLLLASIPVAYVVVAVARTLVDAGRRLLARVRSQQFASGRGLGGKAAVGVLVAAMFVGLTSPGVAASLDEPYYRVVEDEDVDRFRWIEANLDPGTHERFLSHPWKAPVLTAMTGMQPHSFLRPGSSPVNGEDYIDYVTGTSNDTRWLLERDIEIVVGPRMPDSEVFVEPVEGVAVLEEEYAEQQEARRGPAPQ